MKVRTGFVSNSSSSSFILYGIYNPNMENVANVLWDHIGEEKMKAQNYETQQDLVDALTDDPWYLDSIEGAPVDILHYDEYYLGVDLYITRDTLLQGAFSKGELDEIDAFLKKVDPNSTPTVHEGDYYC